MNDLIKKIKEWYEKQTKSSIVRIAGCSGIILIILLCISILMHVNIQRKYTAAVEGMTEQIFQKFLYMEELFSYVDQENIDVEHKLIPQLKGQYTAAEELNKAIVDNYGSRYGVLTQEQIDDFDAAFTEYSNAFASGLSTNLARDDMAILLAEIQDMLNARYNPTPEPTATPVIIQ